MYTLDFLRALKNALANLLNLLKGVVIIYIFLKSNIK
jgi:hypothetical protein